MNGPQHYREAEVQLQAAQDIGANAPTSEAAHLRYAQVHATLALAAATADAAAGGNPEHGFGLLDRDEWTQVTS
jgi:hypothetical protein